MQRISHIFIFILYLTNSVAQTSKLDSLTLLLQHSIDTNGVKTACRIALELSENEPKQCVAVLNKLIPQATLISYYSGKAKLYNIKGICFDILSQYDSAISCYQKAYQIANVHQLLKTKGSALNNLGMVYWNIGNYELAIKNYLQALKQFETLNSETNIANATNNIGLVYADMKNYKEALNFYDKALYINRKLNNQYGIGSVLTNIGIAYYGLNDMNKSAIYLDSSIVIKKNIEDDYGLGISLNHRADVYTGLKQYNAAEKMLRESSVLLERIGNKNMLFANYNELAIVLKKIKKLKEATIYTFKSYDISKEIGSLRKQAVALGNIAVLYQEQQEYKKAYDYLNQSKLLSDSILNIENFESINEMEAKYETEKKEKENLVLTIENNQQKTRNQWIVFIGIGLLILSVLSVWFWMYKRKQQLIKEQNNKLNETILDTENYERERIARDLHDSVGQKLSVVKMQLSMKNTDTQITNHLLDEAIQDVRNVSHNLMPVDLSKGLVKAIEIMCEQINFASTDLKIHFHYNDFSVQLNKQQESFMYRMIQELTNNAMKYAQAKNIDISINYSSAYVSVEVKDDGVGFDTEAIKKQAGIGIKNMQQRVEKLNGKWHIESQINKGTKFNIHFLVR